MGVVSNLRRALVLSGPDFRTTDLYNNLSHNYDAVVCVSTMDQAVA